MSGASTHARPNSAAPPLGRVGGGGGGAGRSASLPHVLGVKSGPPHNIRLTEFRRPRMSFADHSMHVVNVHAHVVNLRGWPRSTRRVHYIEIPADPVEGVGMLQMRFGKKAVIFPFFAGGETQTQAAAPAAAAGTGDDRRHLADGEGEAELHFARAGSLLPGSHHASTPTLPQGSTVSARANRHSSLARSRSFSEDTTRQRLAARDSKSRPSTSAGDRSVQAAPSDSAAGSTGQQIELLFRKNAGQYTPRERVRQEFALDDLLARAETAREALETIREGDHFIIAFPPKQRAERVPRRTMAMLRGNDPHHTPDECRQNLRPTSSAHLQRFLNRRKAQGLLDQFQKPEQLNTVPRPDTGRVVRYPRMSSAPLLLGEGLRNHFRRRRIGS